jgi:hypothetical protein
MKAKNIADDFWSMLVIAEKGEEDEDDELSVWV